MNPIVFTLVSLLAQAQTAHVASRAGRVEVRSLVQGSGTVIVFDNAADMSKAVSK